MDDALVAWLLEGDPAIRWQALRELVRAGPTIVEHERQRVPLEGWGARLLSQQDSHGLWAGSLYIGKWTSTTYSLLLLRHMGLPPDTPGVRASCAALLAGGFHPDGRIVFAGSEDAVDDGVTGMVLSILAYFGCQDPHLGVVAAYLLNRQAPDGRWEPYPGNDTLRYTFACTLLVMDGLHVCRALLPAAAQEIDVACARACEYLLGWRLFKDPRSDAVVHPSFISFPFPPYWFYDVLSALDVLRACDAERDPRLADAIVLLHSRRERNGTWRLNRPHPGRTYFEMEAPGKPSRWNTLRALRVLQWWEGSTAA